MRPVIRLLFCLLPALTPAGLFAADTPEVSVIRSPTSGYYEVRVSGTEPGHLVTCTLLDTAGHALTSNSWQSRSPATTVPIRHTGSDVKSARCTKN